MPAGRPSKYTPELLAEAHKYIDEWKPSEVEVIPSHVGLALHLNLNTDTLYDWNKQPEKKEFSDILKQIMARQQQILINLGLTKQFDSGITKLVLGKHGYQDKIANEHTGADGGPIDNKWSVEFVNPVKKDAKIKDKQ